LNGGIANAKALGNDQPVDVSQHVGTTDTTPFVAVGAEDTAQVSETGSAEKGIAQGMRSDVTVRMTGTPIGVIERKTEEPTRTSRLNRVYVGAETDSWHHLERQERQEAAARTSSRMIMAFSSSVFSANASSPTRICRAFASMRFSPADSPRS
jgi:hypothetical protein